jgi:hypothetical protein
MREDQAIAPTTLLGQSGLELVGVMAIFRQRQDLFLAYHYVSQLGRAV